MSNNSGNAASGGVVAPGGVAGGANVNSRDAGTLPENNMQGDANATGNQTGATQGGANATASDWNGRNHQQVNLSDLDARIRSTLETSARQGQVDPGLTQMDYQGSQIYRARVTMADGERYLYMNTMGDLIKTQQPMELSTAPQMVRTAAMQYQQGATASSLIRETAGENTSYVLRIMRDDQPTRWIQMDEAGNTTNSITQDEIDAQGAEEEASASETPASETPAAGEQQPASEGTSQEEER